jgi:hypothetical protein
MTVGAVASVAVTTFVHARPELARQGSGVAGRVRGRLGWSRGLGLGATKERGRDRRSWCSHCGGLAVRRLGFCFCSPPRLGNMCDYSVMFRGKKKTNYSVLVFVFDVVNGNFALHEDLTNRMVY